MPSQFTNIFGGVNSPLQDNPVQKSIQWETYDPTTEKSPQWETYDPATETPTKPVSLLGGWLDKLNQNKTLNTPVVDFSSLSEPVAQTFEKGNKGVSQAMLDLMPFGIGDIVNKYYQSQGQPDYDPREVTAGAARGIGKLATGFTTPYNLGLMALTEGTGLVPKLGLQGLKYAPLASKALTWGVRAGSAPIAAQGIREATNLATGEEPFTWEKAAGAGLNTVFGGLGMFMPQPGYIAAEAARRQVPKIYPGPMYGPMEPPSVMHGPQELPSGIGPSGQVEFPFMQNELYNQRPPVEPPPPVPDQTGLFNAGESGINYNEPFQGDFTSQFGPYRGPRGRFTRDQPPFIQPGSQQYQLPFDPYVSQEPVPRPTPFQVGNPGIAPVEPPITFPNKPTMADMAPPAPPRTPPPTAPPLGPPPEGAPNIPGVIFKGEYAIITEPSPAKNALLKEMGYEPYGQIGKYGAMKLRDNIAETAYTRAQQGVVPPPTEPSAAVPGMLESPIPIGPSGEINLPKKLATPKRIQKLREQGYSIIEEKSNGDVRLGPSQFDSNTDIARQKVVRAKRGYQDLTPERYKRYTVLDENDNIIHKTYDHDEAQRIADEQNGYVQDSGEIDPGTDIARQKVAGGGLKIDVDERRAATNITKDYTSPLPGIMAREGLQNAFDAVEPLGTNGIVKIRHDKVGNTIEIYDNGKGLDETALGDKLTKLFATGKENVEGASGGKGIGAASYILGGEHFTIETVAVDSIDGKKYRITAGGTPDQFHSPTGSDYERVQVPDSTPTGTTMKVKLTEAQRDEHVHSRIMTDKIIAHSRDKQTKLIYDEYNNTAGTPLKDVVTDDLGGFGSDNEHTFGESKNDKLVGDLNIKNNKVRILVPTFDETIPRSTTEVHYLNNGMYQFTNHLITESGKKVRGIPEHAIVDIHPLVDEMSNDYPFVNTREHIKTDMKQVIDEYLKKSITGPAVSRAKNRTQELYDAMTSAPIAGTTRTPIFYDPGDRLTPIERQEFLNSPFTRDLIEHYDIVINDILDTVNRSKWIHRLEGVGIVLDPGSNGIHIPNPSTRKSSIGFNPFLRIESMSPTDAAWHGTITALHEAAHIGDEAGTNIAIQWSARDLTDPRIGKYMKAYMDQMITHGDVGYSDTGHALDYMQRLGEVFSKYGVAETFDAADQLERIYTDGGKSGGYSPEIQKLLQLYKDSRGRPETTEDLLSATGVKQANRKSTGTGNVPGNVEGHGNGIPPEQSAVKKPGLGRQLYNFTRGVTTTLDLSAPLRQGLPLLFTKEFRKSFGTMMKTLGNEEAFQKSLADLKNRKLFQRQYDPNTGKIVKSFAEMAGMKLSELHGPLSGREEAIASDWVESGGFLGSDVPFLNRETGAQRLFQSTVGRATRASNRAYTAFLNQLRADSFESLIADAHRDFQAGTKGSKNPYTDLTYAREIADFVNTATGRGPLRLATPGVIGGRLGEGGKIGLVERSGEQFAKFFTDVIFSPRLMASRVRMLNPATYMMATPFVRKQYLKSLLSVAAFAGTAGALAKGMGADVSLDPNSADFMKIKVGNTRLDMAGGFQQYIVAASRLISGHTTSSASGKDFELGQGYRPPTRGDVVQNFMTNKLHPVAKFANDLVFASTHQPFQVGDRTLQLFIPLVMGDVLELAKEDPKLLPLLAPITFGAGSQTYSKGSVNSRFLPAKNDINFTGGSPF